MGVVRGGITGKEVDLRWWDEFALELEKKKKRRTINNGRRTSIAKCDFF